MYLYSSWKYISTPPQTKFAYAYLPKRKKIEARKNAMISRVRACVFIGQATIRALPQGIGPFPSSSIKSTFIIRHFTLTP